MIENMIRYKYNIITDIELMNITLCFLSLFSFLLFFSSSFYFSFYEFLLFHKKKKSLYYFQNKVQYEDTSIMNTNFALYNIFLFIPFFLLLFFCSVLSFSFFLKKSIITENKYITNTTFA